MKEYRVLNRVAALLCAVSASFVGASSADAFDFFFSSGPFAIGIGSRLAPPPVVVPVAPPAFYHPSASVYYEEPIEDSVVVDDATDSAEVVVESAPTTIVYGPAYRTAPYLTAVPPPVVLAPIPQPPRRVVVAPSDPWGGPYPVRPNNFRPTPYFGSGPHVPGPNHFGDMTPLGPGPAPAYGRR